MLLWKSGIYSNTNLFTQIAKTWFEWQHFGRPKTHFTNTKFCKLSAHFDLPNFESGSNFVGMHFRVVGRIRFALLSFFRDFVFLWKIWSSPEYFSNIFILLTFDSDGKFHRRRSDGVGSFASVDRGGFYATTRFPLDLVVSLLVESLPVFEPFKRRYGRGAVGGTDQFDPVPLLSFYVHLWVVHQRGTTIHGLWRTKERNPWIRVCSERAWKIWAGQFPGKTEIF